MLPRLTPLQLLPAFLTILPLLLPAAENADQAQQELEQVEAAIGEIHGWLEQARQRQSAEQRNLQQAEQEIAELSRTVSDLQGSIAQTESELEELQEHRQQLEVRKQEQAVLLAQALRTAWLSDGDNFLKMLLNGEEPTAGARMAHYARVFSEAQLQAVERWQLGLQEIDDTDARLQTRLDDADRQRSRLERQLAPLNAAKDSRKTVLARLNADIAERSSELDQLQGNQAELEALLAEIGRAMSGIRSFGDVPPFAGERGQLPAPVDGPIASRFGSRYGPGDLTRRGVVFGVSEGTGVQAIHAGRVVFSDWLRGAGLLVIIDHGDAYMSLYGANQTLLRQAGQWVDRGEQIATSGNAGQGDSPGLYFEIRQQGQPVNPHQWLRAANHR